MDLPFDIKELIASNLQGPDLASMAQVDPDFKGFFRNTVGPIFCHEFKRISKIIAPLIRIFKYGPYFESLLLECNKTIMSYVLDREVEDGEFFEDEFEQNLYYTTRTCISTNNFSSLNEIIDIYKSEMDQTIREKQEFLDKYYIYNNLDYILNGLDFIF